jgi:Zn-dependent metalloprotease
LRQLATKAGDERVGPSPQSTLEVDEAFRLHRTTAARGLQTAVAPSTADRIIHTANNTQTLPGEVARTDEQPPVGDLAVDEAWDSSAQVWDLFDQIFGRASMDGQGTTLSVTVHYGVNYDNAFWDGQQLVFGDGDGKIFDRFTKPMDVLAHEFTHGVTQFTAALGYQDQPGALNESVSDVFAAMTKQRALDQTADQADWLIGQGLFTASVQGRALRDMVNPGTAYDDDVLGKDPQPADMSDYVSTGQDNGGVHINSGIPNRAFALAAKTIGGNAWEKAGLIWYDTIRDPRLRTNASFASFARLTVRNAGIAFGETEVKAVHDAWNTVGVKVR